MESSYFPLKTKRKELEHVDDDFSDFSFCSPATKIRRLNAELPPILEEDEEVFDFPAAVEVRNGCDGSPEGDLGFENEERAIVVFNPNKTAPLLQNPSNFSVSIDPNLISGFKIDHALWPRKSSSWSLPSDEAREEDDDSGGSNGCLAVVPWVASQFTSASNNSSQFDNAEMMDVEGMEGMSMDVEDNDSIIQQRNVNEGGVNIGEGLHLWQQQQQHCMIPPPPHNPSTPIVWYR